MSSEHKSRGIFIGRFQPFHKGHLSAVWQMDQNPNIDELIIGIGGSQYKNEIDNPFSKKERRIMLNSSIKIDKPFTIIDIPDIHNYPIWVSHVEKIASKFEVVYTGNRLVRKLFEERGYQVQETDKIYNISATEIRYRMIQKKDWKEFVPVEVYELIKSFGGERRLNDLYHKFMRPVVASDLIIVYKDCGIPLIKRGVAPFEGFWAINGGHLNVGFENTKEAAIREAEEETGIKLDPEKVKLFGVYSEVQRDPRGPNIAIVYWTKVAEGEFRAGDDAKDIRIFPFDKIPKIMAFDHRLIIDDFLKFHFKQKFSTAYPHINS